MYARLYTDSCRLSTITRMFLCNQACRTYEENIKKNIYFLFKISYFGKN